MRATKAFLLASTVAAMLQAAPALAADMPLKAPEPVAVDVWNPWMVRVRVVGVVPRDSGSLHIPDPTLNATLAGAGLSTVNPVPGNPLAVSKTVIPEIDISYFFTPNIALELILGVTPHKVTGQGLLAGLDVAQTWLLPPTLTLQYHFTNFGAFKPYIGGGVNYTIFFNTTGSNIPAVVPLTAPIGVPLTVTSLHVKDSFAPVAQIGFDYMLTKNVGVNFDVKKLWLRPQWNGSIAVGDAAAAPALFPTPFAMNGKVNLDPWLVGGGVTYKF